MEELLIDCREMVPPEPMILVMETLPQLGQGQRLRMLHRHVPVHLLPKLQDLGFTFEVIKDQPDDAELVIFKP